MHIIIRWCVSCHADDFYNNFKHKEKERKVSKNKFDIKEEKKVCDMRWYPERGLPKVMSPVFSPFTYGVTVLGKVCSMNSTDIVEFIQGGSVVFTGTAKMITDMLKHVNGVLEKADLSILTDHELNLLKYAQPWDFWKNKEVQAIIKKFI